MLANSLGPHWDLNLEPPTPQTFPIPLPLELGLKGRGE